ncbi:conserved hypothetical protein [Flavobacterium psychrophilum]|uniref:hypothetical protein n=1 Tax=Flavobacterium psychrophilum TaxID=96345 RepID=UPI000B7C4695|nr:hypothetical protein [Flavobacterium psychrophilum]SNB26152.1 conserved hypothetical protein [Flavobacterium psychrophilum]
MITYLSKIIKINNLNVVGVIKKEDGESFHVLTIKKNGNKIDIVSKRAFETFDDLATKIDLKLPVLLVIDGKGVLNKEIDFNKEADVNWHKNIDFNTIYHTSFKSGNNNFISFCRKNSIDEIVAKFKKAPFQVMDIYIGSFLSALLHHAINKDTIASGDLILSFENEKLIGFTKPEEQIKKESYNIGIDAISSNILPLYGALIHFFIQQKEVSKTKNEELNVEEIIYKKAFNIFGVTMLVGFLFSLLTSYCMIQYYGSKNVELNLKNVYSNQSYQKIVDLEKEKENKLNILKESGFLSSKFLSYYGYELMKNIPNDLTLNEVNIIPAGKEIKANKKITFDAKTILVKGETFNESSINNWMDGLKKMNWINNFEIISLKKDKKNKSQFEVKITIKDV